MKVVHTEVLMNNGIFAQSTEHNTIMSDIHEAVKRVVWPTGASEFTINPQKQINGVKPIKQAFVTYLAAQGWVPENRLDIENASRPGPIDATFQVGKAHFAVEWETGNISSSHRALNKMVIGLLRKKLVGGVLVLPTRKLYRYLTDRIGNYAELEPYFDVWRSVSCREGFLAVVAIEHDSESFEVNPIPKGTDGRALL